MLIILENKQRMSKQQLTRQCSASELLWIDYMNIQDCPYLQQILQIYHYKQKQILEQIKQYSTILSRNKGEHTIIMDKIKQLSKDYHVKNQRLAEQININRDLLQKKIKQINEDHDKSMKNIESISNSFIKEQNQAIKKCVEDQKNYKQIQIEELGYINEIKGKAKMLIDKQYEHHDNMNKHETKQNQNSKKALLQNLEIVQDLKKNVMMYASNVVYQQKFENEDKNYELKSRLLVLQEQLTKLRRQRNEALANKKQTKMNVAINQQQLEQYKAVGSIQKSKIKFYNDKIDYMKKNITSELGKLQNKIKEKRKKWQNEMKGLRMKMFNCEKSKGDLKTNLQKYRTLGETILMQREEVEDFFLLAIESCKRQMLQTEAMHDNNDKPYGEKVDIDELLPRDKHRILTNLYTKLALGPK